MNSPLALLRKTRCDRVLWTALLPFLASGCCSFAPCHRATSLLGSVADTRGQAIEDAHISLYGSSVASGSGGCFKVHLADAQPFELAIAADGYQPVRTAARPGHYRIAVVLARSGEANPVLIHWQAISSEEYAMAATCFRRAQGLAERAK